MQQRGLAGIVETEEEELGVLVGEPEVGEDIPDCGEVRSVREPWWMGARWAGAERRERAGGTYTN